MDISNLRLTFWNQNSFCQSAGHTLVLLNTLVIHSHVLCKVKRTQSRILLYLLCEVLQSVPLTTIAVPCAKLTDNPKTGSSNIFKRVSSFYATKLSESDTLDVWMT